MIVNNIELDDSSSRSSLLLDGGGGERKRRIAGEWLGGASSVSSPRSCSCGSPATLIGIHRHLVSVTARESEREKKRNFEMAGLSNMPTSVARATFDPK